jgi:threonine synthase
VCILRLTENSQDIVKALFADPTINKTQKLAAVNSINWARILAQITYYFQSYFALKKSSSFNASDRVRFVVPTGNFGDVLAGFFAKRMGLPAERLIVATNENDILDRFWKSGNYEKKAVHGKQANRGITADGAKAHIKGARETLSPAMDILVSSNFERLLWYLAYDVYGEGSVSSRRKTAGEKVKGWLEDLKSRGGFGVDSAVLTTAKQDFESERVSDSETIQTIREVYSTIHLKSSRPDSTIPNGDAASDGYIVDPHSAIGIAASWRSMKRTPTQHTHHISLATAHPAKFANAVDLALKESPGYSFDKVMPKEFVGLEAKERRVQDIKKSLIWEGVRDIIQEGRASEPGS